MPEASYDPNSDPNIFFGNYPKQKKSYWKSILLAIKIKFKKNA